MLVMMMTVMMSVKYYPACTRVTDTASRSVVTSFLPQIVARGCILPSFVPVFWSNAPALRTLPRFPEVTD